MQIFELWESTDASGDNSGYYVKCIYNYEDLSLAHHSNGQSPASQHTLPSRPCHCLHFDCHLACWCQGTVSDVVPQALHILLWSMSVALQVSLCCWRSSGTST